MVIYAMCTGTVNGQYYVAARYFKSLDVQHPSAMSVFHTYAGLVGHQCASALVYSSGLLTPKSWTTIMESQYPCYPKCLCYYD